MRRWLILLLLFMCGCTFTPAGYNGWDSLEEERGRCQRTG